MLLVGLAGMMLILIGAILGLMTLASWLGWPRVGLIIGVAGALYFAATAVDILVYCRADPVFVPPVPEDAGQSWGSIAGCDGPGGALSYAYATLAAPIASLFLAVSTWRRWSNLKELTHG